MKKVAAMKVVTDGYLRKLYSGKGKGNPIMLQNYNAG